MELPRIRISERQVLITLMGVTIFCVVCAFLWSAFLTGKTHRLESSARVRWMRPRPATAVRVETPYLLSEYLDPSGMALPGPHGFSQGAWKQLAPPAMESYAPEQSATYLAPPSGLAVPVLLQPKTLEEIVREGLERPATDVGQENPEALGIIPPPVTNSVIQIIGALSKRRLVLTPPLPAIPANTTPRVARILVAVSQDGHVRYAVLDRSSGNDGLDADAMQVARQLQFEMQSVVDPLEVTWGTVLFYWAMGSGH